MFCNCYTAGDGAIFYLPVNTVFLETDSTYKQNAAKFGNIYCAGCTATMTRPVFKDNWAQDGSIMYMLDGA